MSSAAPDVLEPIVVNMASVEPCDASWLWYPYMALGAITLLEADPGVGKSWTAYDIASRVSRGMPMPGDGLGREPGNVILLVGEDSLSHTVATRLISLGANLNRISVLEGWRQKDEEYALMLTEDGLQVLATAIEELRPHLVVIDPLFAYMGAAIDIHRANQVRSVTRPLGALAKEYECSILAIRHLNKSLISPARYRGQGNIDFTAVARSVLTIGTDPGDETATRRVMVHLKTNLAEAGPAQAFHIRHVDWGCPFEWLGPVDLTAEEVLATESEDIRSAVESAMEFLLTVLADGERPARAVSQEAADLRISERSLQRARSRLKIRSRRVGTRDVAGSGCWYLSLPEDEVPEDPQGELL